MTSQQPIFPPEGINYSVDALKASASLLDEETLAILAADRARQRQSVALGVYTLGQEIGLSDETTQQILNGLQIRLENMSPDHHRYVSQLLGAAASTLAGQLRTPNSSELQAEPQTTPEVASNGHVPVVPTESLLTPLASQPEPLAEYQAEAMIGSPPQSLPENGDKAPGDLVEPWVLPAELKLYDHTVVPKHMSKFLSDVFPDEITKIMSLAPREASLIVYELLEQYAEASIPYVPASYKAVHRFRIEEYTGLYDLPLVINDLMVRLKVSSGAFYQGMLQVSSYLGKNVEAGPLFEKAKATVQQMAIADNFTSEVIDRPLPPVMSVRKHNGSHDFSPQPEKKDNPLPVIDERVFFEHLKVPAGMRNFLLGVFPRNYIDKIMRLDPKSASQLTYQLLKEYQNLTLPGLSDEARAQRNQWIERWTGLYSSPQEESEIALRSTKSTTVVKDNLRGVIRVLENKVPRAKLSDIYERATARKPSDGNGLSSVRR